MTEENDEKVLKELKFNQNNTCVVLNEANNIKICSTDDCEVKFSILNYYLGTC